MVRNRLAAFVIVAAVPSVVQAASPPPAALLGKSVIIAWGETRQQRAPGQGNFRPVNASQNFSIYISSAGRVFSRFTLTTPSGTGRGDQVAGESTGRGAPRVPVFNGQSLTVFAPFNSGGMRHLVVDFGSGFGSCSARVSYAKEAGTASSIAFSPITKGYVEIQSISFGNASCSVQSGNVFGGQ